MWMFYFLACLPVVIGFALWLKNDKVVLWEWAAGAALAFLIAGIMHYVAFNNVTGDFETWSGRIVSATYEPAWRERYTETETYSCGTAKEPKTCTRTVTRYANYDENWYVTCTVNGDVDVSKEVYDLVMQKFGGTRVRAEEQWRGHVGGTCVGGDNYRYRTNNDTGFVFPTNASQSVTNYIKGAPTLFGYSKVESPKVYEYPRNPSFMQSGRLLGTASKDFTIRALDLLNEQLGPTKKVNVVIVGFDSTDSSLGHLQEAKWIGGKKNDLVICYGNGWSYVFGWTEKDICKRNLETIFLSGAKNDGLLPLVKAEIVANYTLVDWDKFNYISVSPPTWTYVVFFILQIIVQGGFYFFAHANEYDKFNRFRQHWRRY